MDYKEKIYNLIEERKTQTLQIEEIMTNESIYYMKIFKLYDSIQITLKNKENITILMRNLYLLGSFVSSVLEISNSFEKLELLESILDDYDFFVSSNIPLSSKFSLTEYSKLSIYPAKSQLDVKKILKSHKKKRLIYKEFIKASKIVSLPINMNYCILIQSVCNIIDLIYNIFADKILNYKESYETIMRIDGILINRFFGVIYNNIMIVGGEVMKEEFIKINDILFNSDTDEVNIEQFLNNN